MKINKRIIWITQSALFLGLVIAVQAATTGFGIQLITGSLVNLTLILCVMLCGYAQGLTAAALSPLFAKLLSIGPTWELIPFISFANVIIVTVWFFIGNLGDKCNKWGRGDSLYATNAPRPHLLHLLRTAFHIAALVAGAAAKFLFLYFSIVRIMIPYVLTGLPEKKANALSATFSVTQLFTALIGGGLAVILIPLIKKAIKTQRT